MGVLHALVSRARPELDETPLSLEYTCVFLRSILTARGRRPVQAVLAETILDLIQQPEVQTCPCPL